MTASLILLLFLGSFYAGLLAFGRPKKFPYATAVLSVILALCLAVQTVFPNILPLLERSPLFFAGEWWRVVSALFFQDGGVVGGLSNIFFLILIGTLAENAFGKGRWLLFYFGTGLLAEVLALYLQPVGAGNSIAIAGLAAALCARVLLSRGTFLPKVLSGLCILVALVLAVEHDIHGAAFLIGMAVFLLWWVFAVPFRYFAIRS